MADTDTVPEVLVDAIHDTCACCPVRTACLAYAEATGVTGGFWAGQDRDPEAIWREIEWVPVIGRSGRPLGEQGLLPLPQTTGARTVA